MRQGVRVIDILELVDRLEALVDRGRRLPLRGMVVLDEEQLLNIIDQMRIVIPQEIREARELLSERDRYLARAQDEARRVLAQASEEAEALLSRERLRAEAEAQAEEMLSAARAEAESTVRGADEYAEASLRDLGDRVAHLQQVIQNGLGALEGRRTRPGAGRATARAKAEGVGAPDS